ncbi:MAG: ABC transporter permease [Microgenomates group bacterium]|jgi:putative ABC transport system permease protein
MQFDQIIFMAIRSLQANKVRSFLTMLGVIIGVMSVILLTALGSGLQGYIVKQLENVGSNLIIVYPGKLDLKSLGQGGMASITSPKFVLKDANDLETQSQYIEAVVPSAVAQGVLKYQDQKTYTELLGLTANFSQVMNSPLASGEYFTESDDRSGRKVIILGSEIAKNLFGTEEPIDKKVVVNESRFTVIGVLKNRGVSGGQEDHVVIPITTEMHLFNQNKVFALYAKVINSNEMDAASADIKRILLGRLTEDDFTLLTMKDLLGAVSSILDVLTLALGGIAAISLLVGGIGIMNIMLVSVTERTQEIGLRKALGATPNVIMIQFLIEAVVLSVGGGMIGMLLGGGIALIMRLFIPTEVTLWSVSLAFSVSAIIGIVFGVMPARKAAKMNPIEALRYE